MLQGSAPILTILLIILYQISLTTVNASISTQVNDRTSTLADSNRTAITGAIPGKLANVMFNVEPLDSGYITCNHKTIITGLSIKINFGSACSPKPNADYKFSYWSQELGATSSKTLRSTSNSTLVITHDGNLTARFEKIFRLSSEFVLNQYFALSLAIFSGLSAPHLVPYLENRRQKSNMRMMYTAIEQMDDPRWLEHIIYEISRRHYFNKINYSQYVFLKDELSAKYADICLKKIETIKNLAGLKELKSQITDAFSKKILDEPRYTMLIDNVISYEKKFKSQ